MRHIKTFEAKEVKLPDGCRRVSFREMVNSIKDLESSAKSSEEGGFDFEPFEKFSTYELNKLKGIVSRFDGYFSTADNSNALFLHSVFDPNSSPYLLSFKSEHSLKIPQLIYFNARHSKKTKSFSIAKREDGWFLVHIKDYNSENWDEVYQGIQFSHAGAHTQNDSYYICDQFEPLVEFIIQQTKMYRTYNKEEKLRKGERDKKTNNLLNKIKSLSWEEFEDFYKKFMK